MQVSRATEGPSGRCASSNLGRFRRRRWRGYERPRRVSVRRASSLSLSFTFILIPVSLVIRAALFQPPVCGCRLARANVGYPLCVRGMNRRGFSSLRRSDGGKEAREAHNRAKNLQDHSKYEERRFSLGLSGLNAGIPQFAASEIHKQ